jgi:hypothetical protein
MTKLFVIGLDSTNGHFVDFQNTVESYKTWCDENGKEFFGELETDFDLDFISLSDFGDSEFNFVCFNDLEALKNVEYSEKKLVVKVIYDIDSFENHDSILDYLKSQFNYLEYPLSSDSGSQETIKFEDFIKVNCTV